MYRLCIVILALLWAVPAFAGSHRSRQRTDSDLQRVPDVSVLIQPWDQVRIYWSPRKVDRKSIRTSDPSVRFAANAGYFFKGNPVDLLVIGGKVIWYADRKRPWRPLAAFDANWHFIRFIDTDPELSVWRGLGRKRGFHWPKGLPPNVVAMDFHCQRAGDRTGRQYFYLVNNRGVRFRQSYGTERDCRLVAQRETRNLKAKVYFIDGGSTCRMTSVPVCMAICIKAPPARPKPRIPASSADPLALLARPNPIAQLLDLPGLRP